MNKGFISHANKTSVNGSINSDNDSGCAQDEYAWVPPGLLTEQVRNLSLDKYLYYILNA